MSTQHKPGTWHAIQGDVLNHDRPWGIVQYLSLEACREIDGDDAKPNSRTEVIAELTATDDPEVVESCAKLMAAAPDLLAALDDLLEQASRTDAGVWLDASALKDYIATVARAAIAKAKGTT